MGKQDANREEKKQKTVKWISRMGKWDASTKVNKPKDSKM